VRRREEALFARIAATVVVTVIECPGVFLWLYLDDKGEQLWALVALATGELLESGLLVVDLSLRPKIRLPPAEQAPALRHARSVRRLLAAAIPAEIGVWLTWLWLAGEVGQAWAAAALVLLMHLKHQLETAAVRGTGFFADFFTTTGVVASISESAGAVACLALIRDGQPVLAAAALVAGITIEHAILIDQLLSERDRGDIRLPRSSRRPPQPDWAKRWLWSRDGFTHGVQLHFGTNYRRFWRLAERRPRLRRAANRMIVNLTVGRMPPRPNRLSTKADYTSWDSLTDRSWSGRHLPPVSPGWPDMRRTLELFRRDAAAPLESRKSTLLFPHFAQWFTDGFIRTDPANPLKNVSTHDVDLSQLYGKTCDVTNMLRSGTGGKLKSQCIDDDEYPPFYFGPDGRPQREFELLDIAYPGAGAPGPPLDPERKHELFALAIPRGNVHYGFVMLSTLFLREHNRLCDRLAAENPRWRDDRLFETARNILIALLLKVVIEDYINHITPFRFPLSLQPGLGARERWHRQNWMSIEFDLLYRWHSLVPDCVVVDGARRPMREVMWDNRILLYGPGLATLFEEASRQPSAEIALRNTADFLMEVERITIGNGRIARLATYNDYREACGYPRLTSFAELTCRRDVQERLAAVYRRVDDVELYVGLFAEDVAERAALPLLMGTMVGVDAFSQALTNPLLADGIFGEQTFTATGMQTIAATRRLADIVHRNCGGQEPDVSFTRADWDGG
jgi:prostaglandin-endoperoxide synthase 2